jgi:hypothetical protein
MAVSMGSVFLWGRILKGFSERSSGEPDTSDPVERSGPGHRREMQRPHIAEGEFTSSGVGHSWRRRQDGLTPDPARSSASVQTDPRDAVLNTIARNIGDYPDSFGAHKALGVLLAAKNNGTDTTSAFRVAADLAVLTDQIKQKGGINGADPATIESLKAAFAFVTASAAPVSVEEATAKLNNTLAALKGPSPT